MSGGNSTVNDRLIEYAKVDSRYSVNYESIYDVLSSYAWDDNDDNMSWAERAEHDAQYVDVIIACANQIFGEGVLRAK